MWIFSQAFILLVTSLGRGGVLVIFVCRDMYATFWGLKLPLKAIFCLKFATWISHFGGKFSATANF